jgi:FkbM family methyltransferase
MLIRAVRAVQKRLFGLRAGGTSALPRSAVIVGCGRDAAPYLDGVLRNIEIIGGLYTRAAFVFVENDSRDETRKLLMQWASAGRRRHLLSFDGRSEDYPLRTARLARARNGYLNFIRKSRYRNFDHLIVLDLDDVNAKPIDRAALTRAITFIDESSERQAAFANALPVYYDIWALRHTLWCPKDCWDGRDGEAPDGWAEREVYARQRFISSDTPPIPVESAFGGMGIYRMSSALSSRYVGINSSGREVCEHVAFNQGVGRHGSLYVLPSLTVTAPVGHLSPKVALLQDSRELVLVQDGREGRLLCPAGHLLDQYRAQHPLYDRRLPALARLVSEAWPDRTIVDVGANIGDTIALCRLSGCTAPIIGVEPSHQYFGYLEINTRSNPTLFADVTIQQVFIGDPKIRYQLEEGLGTAHIRTDATGVDDASDVPTFSFDMLAAAHISLIKIDTDGFDAAIIDSNADYLATMRPVIWAEADTRDICDEQKWTEVLRKLTHTHPLVCVFDNFGFLVGHGELSEKHQLITDLISYSRRHKAASVAAFGAPRIYYLDIAFFPRSQEDLFGKFLSELLER